MGPSGRVGYTLHILDCLGQVNAGFIQVLYLGRAPRTKETLPDFREKCRVTRHSRVFRGLTGSQRTPGFGASHFISCTCILIIYFSLSYTVLFIYFSCIVFFIYCHRVLYFLFL